MPLLLVTLCYGSATLLSLFLLWYFGAQRWYWHLLSLAAAMTLGLTPGNEFLSRPEMTLVVGWFFVFLFLWGVGGPAFYLNAHPPGFHLKHR